MESEKSDRRVQRTRQLLRQALIQLIAEKGYAAVTIQDITERANLGRTTFYLHYQSKDDLFLDHHSGMATGFYLGQYTKDEFLADAPPEMIARFLTQIYANRRLYFKITGGKEVSPVIEGVRQQMADELEASLRAAFPESESHAPFLLLAHYITGAQLSLVSWWLENRNAYTPQMIAQLMHQLQRAAIVALVISQTNDYR